MAFESIAFHKSYYDAEVYAYFSNANLARYDKKCDGTFVIVEFHRDYVISYGSSGYNSGNLECTLKVQQEIKGIKTAYQYISDVRDCDTQKALDTLTHSKELKEWFVEEVRKTELFNFDHRVGEVYENRQMPSYIAEALDDKNPRAVHIYAAKFCNGEKYDIHDKEVLIKLFKREAIDYDHAEQELSIIEM